MKVNGELKSTNSLLTYSMSWGLIVVKNWVESDGDGVLCEAFVGPVGELMLPGGMWDLTCYQGYRPSFNLKTAEDWSTGMMVAVFRQVGSMAWCSELLKMVVKTAASWCAHDFSTLTGILLIWSCWFAGVSAVQDPQFLLLLDGGGLVVIWRH